MQPLKPYYLGLGQPPAPRIASAQKCLRTGDIEEVGKTERHLTFFEMLGNFAPTGDYFKETAIPLAWDLVTSGFGMPVERLRVTVHPSDDQAFEIWTTATGIPAEHVTRDGTNWWGLGRGPAGPDSEIWWDRGREAGCGQPDCYPDHCKRFTEIWNLVFPQYDQRGDLASPPSTADSIQRGVADEKEGLERHERPPGQGQCLRDRPPCSARRIREGSQHQPGGAVGKSHRGPPTRDDLLRRGWSRPLQRGTRLRAAPPDPARRAARPQHRHARKAFLRRQKGGGDVRGALPRAARTRRFDHRDDRHRNRTLRAHTRAGHGAVREGCLEGRQARIRHRRVPAARYLRLSPRADARAGR